MNRFGRFAVATVFCLLGLIAPAAGVQDVQSKDELHVLFIGNSLTYVNDLPGMVVQLAEAGKDRPLNYEKEAPDGCTLKKHWKDGKALAKIRSRRWDWVVLQDQSGVALKKRDSLFEYARKFDAEIKKNGARTMLYMTWAMQDRPDDQAAISRAYLDLAKELQAGIAPVGDAWRMALKADQKLVLHQPDKRHPSIAGTYLAACVFYAAIYGKSPVGLHGGIGTLSDAVAAPLQVIAWKSVQAMGRQ